MTEVFFLVLSKILFCVEGICRLFLSLLVLPFLWRVAMAFGTVSWEEGYQSH